MLSLAKVRINTISFRAVSENQVEISQGKGYNLTIMNPNLTEHGVDNYSSEDPVLNIISDGVLFQTQKGTSVNFTFDSVHEPGNYHLSIFNASCSRIKDITDWTVLPSGVWYDSANRTIHIDPSVLAGSAGTYRFEVSDVKRPVRIPSPVENAVPENISGSTDTGYLPGLISSRLFQIDLRHGLLAVIVDHTEYSSVGNGSQGTMIRGGAGDMYLSLGNREYR